MILWKSPESIAARQQIASADAVLLVNERRSRHGHLNWLRLGEPISRGNCCPQQDPDLLPNGFRSAAPSDRPAGHRDEHGAWTAVESRGLIAAVAAHLVGDVPAAGAAVPFTASQVARLRAARGHADRRDSLVAAIELRAMTSVDEFEAFPAPAAIA